MADVSVIAVPSSNVQNFPLATVTATTKSLAPHAKFMISADQTLMLTFYSSTGGAVAAAANVGFRYPAGVVIPMDLGDHCDTIGIFNTSASTANISLQPFTAD